MASQITHVVYGKKIFDRHPNLSWKGFLIGTLFPDIRHYAKISRDKLHVQGTSESLIPKNDSFKAGMYVHSLVDEKREKYISSKGIYDLLPKSKYVSSALKLVEDELVYDEIKNWEAIIRVLDSYSEEEFGVGIKKDEIKNWHKVLQEYFKKKPDFSGWRKMAFDMSYSEKVARDVFKEVKIIRDNPKVLNIILETKDII